MKADSIKTLNESKIRQLAKFEDRNRGVVSNQVLVTSRILAQESSALSFAYAEIIKNKEMTDVNLKDMQPLFMAIDTPFSPITTYNFISSDRSIERYNFGRIYCCYFCVWQEKYLERLCKKKNDCLYIEVSSKLLAKRAC